MVTKESTLSRSRDGSGSAQEGTSGADRADGWVPGFEAVRGRRRSDDKITPGHWRLPGSTLSLCGARLPVFLIRYGDPTEVAVDDRCGHINCRLLWEAAELVASGDFLPFTVFPAFRFTPRSRRKPIIHHWRSSRDPSASACGRAELLTGGAALAPNVSDSARCHQTGCRARWSAYDRIQRAASQHARGNEEFAAWLAVDLSREGRAHFRKALGLQLRVARERARLSQEEAAWRLELSQKSISCIEAGTKPLHVDRFLLLCKLYEVPPGELLGGIK